MGLPHLQSPGGPAILGPNKETHPNMTLNLLIVDDHAGVRKLIRQLIAGSGDNVRECGSGGEAIQTVVQFRPDFVTMDIRMPGISGFEAARAVRLMHPSAKVVIVSSFDQPGLRSAAAAAGAIAFVVKENLSDLQSIVVRKPASGSDSRPDRGDFQL
jgi:DNA-binding NarL/FixJ family response regulator